MTKQFHKMCLIMMLTYMLAVAKNDPKKPKLERKEQQLADRVLRLLTDFENETTDIQEETVLEVMGDDGIDEDWDAETALDQDELSYDGMEHANYVIFHNKLVEIDKVKEAIDFYTLSGTTNSGKKRRRGLKSMSTAFRFLKTDYDLRRLVNYEISGTIVPDRRAMIGFISHKLFEKVIDCVHNGYIIHDQDLQAMVEEIKNDFGIKTSFYGSPNWLNSWKRNHHISSRNITTMTSKKNFTNKDKIAAAAEEFVKKSKVHIQQNYSPMEVFNLDQSGLQKEIFSKRTLTITGSKKVECVTSSSNGTHQSYTILPLLRMDGYFYPKLFVVLAEKNGAFPTTVPIYTADNLVVLPGRSHIMGTELMKEFMKRMVFSSDMPDKTCLLVDSWAPWRNKTEIDTVRPASKTVEMLVIPPGATGHIQPLDVGIFNNVKRFDKTITKYAQRCVPAFSPHQRDNILRMVSQIYFQICSPRFQEWRAHAWSSAGYTDPTFTTFETPTQYCFSPKRFGRCEVLQCALSGFLVCGYCEKRTCFQHCIIENHRC